MENSFYINPQIKILHNAVLKRFNIKSFDELDTTEKQTSALNYMEKKAEKLIKKTI